MSPLPRLMLIVAAVVGLELIAGAVMLPWYWPNMAPRDRWRWARKRLTLGVALIVLVLLLAGCAHDGVTAPPAADVGCWLHLDIVKEGAPPVHLSGFFDPCPPDSLRYGWTLGR